MKKPDAEELEHGIFHLKPISWVDVNMTVQVAIYVTSIGVLHHATVESVKVS